MNKTKDINFRLTGIDYEFIFRYAKKHDLKVSDVLRNFIKNLREQWEKENICK